MDIAAIITAVSLLVAALAAAFVTVYSGIKRVERGQGVIQKDVNSNMTYALREIGRLNEQLALLTGTVADRIKADAAHARTMRSEELGDDLAKGRQP